MSEYNWIQVGLPVTGITGVDLGITDELTDIKCSFKFPLDTITAVEFIIKAADVANYYTKLTEYQHEYQQGMAEYEAEVQAWIDGGRQGDKPTKPASLVEPERTWGKYSTNTQPPYMQFDVDVVRYMPADVSEESELITYRYVIKLVKCTTAIDDVTMSTHVTYYKDIQFTEDNLV